MSETTNQENNNKSVKMCSIRELLNYNFVIPSYQRGYRWEKREVEDLLNDIYEFYEENKDDKGFYCLQPLVLKKTSDNKYEVIDGQQRLTTIYLILKYLEKEIFNIEYDTRKDSKKFLNKIDSITNEELNHIDLEYIKKSYEVIKNWFNNDDSKKTTIGKILTDKKSVQFIWYEPSDNANPIEIFTRINIGKIPLTNSELIKALFLQKANFIHDENFDEALYEHTQIEIASEWDYIENTLQDNRFWGFINNDMDKKYNRIDYIFEIVSDKLLEKDKQDKKISEENLKEIGEDGYKTFRYFYKKWKYNENKMSFVQDIWKEIRYCFYAMNKWYNDLTFYHYIGYIIYWSKDIKKDIIELYNSYTNNTKIEFHNKLSDKIKLILKNIKYYNENNNCNIYYDNKTRDNIRKLLLLYNIEYMLKNNNSYSKFPFDLFKGKTWDIEHIEPKTPQSEAELEQYIKTILENKYVKNELNTLNNEFKNIKDDDKNRNKKLSDLYKKIKNEFSNDKNIIDEELKDYLGNLVLLDSKTNREYHNAFFTIKRKIIIDKEKNESNFIPICTKYVFLKYFDENIETSSVHQWTKTDAIKYEKDIYNTLEKFLTK
ncbi:DUF262 domain-containing protein [Brachyspira pulli]|uniref:DUF262 domain-containing protein n=1 Tax=Brachyspira pulli TaxID=310721 RepID=UPI0030052ED6